LRTPSVTQAIASVPRQNRSVANVLQLWNGVWAGPQELGGAANLATLQAAVRNTLGALPAECGTQLRTGPAFFLLSSAGEDVTIVIGSGQWSWSQLVAPASDASAGPPSPDPAPDRP
jgi:hypothetical protein